jgi:hypothetical protein
VDYSLFIGGDDGVDIREGREATEGDSGSVSPLQSLLEQPLFLCFVFLCRLLIVIVEGVFI